MALNKKQIIFTWVLLVTLLPLWLPITILRVAYAVGDDFGQEVANWLNN